MTTTKTEIAQMDDAVTHETDLQSIVDTANAACLGASVFNAGMRIGRVIIRQQANGLWCVYEQRNGSFHRVTVKGQPTPERAKHDAIARLLS